MSYNPSVRGTIGNISSRQLVTGYTSGSGSAIPQCMAVSTNTIGAIVPLDVSDPTSVQGMVGYAFVRIPSSAMGDVISGGRLENITIGFPIGSPLYVGTDGNPTNIVPSVGVNGFNSGDAVIFMGVLVHNQFDNTLTDLQILTQMVGTL